MADPTGLSTVLAGKALDATIGYVKTANRYNARHKDLEDLVHTTGAFLEACREGIARPIVQRVFQDVQPVHTGAQVLLRKRQDWEDNTTTFGRHLRLHTRWKLSKDALDHTHKIRTTDADTLPQAILLSVLDLQKELKSLRDDVRDIKSSLGHSEACKQGTTSQETQTRKQEKRKQKRRKRKTSKQEKDDEVAAGKGMNTARADHITHFSRGVRNIQERLTDSIMEVGHDGISVTAVWDEDSIRSALNTQTCPSTTVISESWDSTITGKSFRGGRDLTNVVLPDNTRETEHMEAEETELAEDVGIENENHKTKMVEVECTEPLYGSTASQYITPQISYGTTGNYTFEALMTATDNFANLIGQGGSANVYKGCLPDGSRIAVKHFWRDSEDSEQEFGREIRCSLEHPALVKILGWCAPAPAFAQSRWQRSFLSRKKKELLSDSKRKKCLVMEYLGGGSLHDHLFGDNDCGLEWPVRLKICIGVADGISFLHKRGIVHCDVKPSNILLDENFSPKITDFGISHVLSESTSRTKSATRYTDRMYTEGLTASARATATGTFMASALFMESALGPDFDGDTTIVRGTPGYFDPAYFQTSKVGPKSDVYSFGTTLLNVLSGRRAMHVTKEKPLVVQANILFSENNVRELIDPKMERTVEDVTDVEEVVRIALLCCELLPKDRPTMDEVYSMLLKVGNKC